MRAARRIRSPYVPISLGRAKDSGQVHDFKEEGRCWPARLQADTEGRRSSSHKCYERAQEHNTPHLGSSQREQDSLAKHLYLFKKYRPGERDPLNVAPGSPHAFRRRLRRACSDISVLE